MNETDQRHPINSIVATDHEIHIRLGGLAVAIRLGADATDTAVINEALYLPLYEVLAREIVKRDEAGGAPPPQQMPLARQIEIRARLESLERDVKKIQSNIDASLTTRISKLEGDITVLRVQQGHQGDVNADIKKDLTAISDAFATELSSAVAALRKERAAPPELASLVELVTGQQDQIDKLQAMLEPRIPAGVVDGRPVAGPEIGIALDGEIARAIDRHDLATRTHVDEAIRRLAATIRQYVRDQVQQALRRRPSALRRVWDALADRGAAAAPAPEPAAVPPAIAEMAEQALRRGR